MGIAKVREASGSTREKIGKFWNGTANICGVLALIITVSWTFPSEVWQAYFRSQEEMKIGLQNSIAKMSEIYKDYAESQTLQINDQTKIMLSVINSIQIRYELDKISRYQDYIFENASYFENLTLGGLSYQVQYYDQAIKFNEYAISSALRLGLEPQEAYVAMAGAVLGRDGLTGIEKARGYFRIALQLAQKRKATGRVDYSSAPLSVLVEVALAELKYGSQECGSLVASRVERALQSSQDLPMAQSILYVFKSNVAAIAKVSDRAPFSCDYGQELPS